jgi:signal transduction histidine kinase
LQVEIGEAPDSGIVPKRPRPQGHGRPNAECCTINCSIILGLGGQWEGLAVRDGRRRWRGWRAVSIEALEASDAVQQLRETCHDMRQPVANVLALAAAALTEPGLPAAAKGWLEEIVGQAEWLADMIHAFLADGEQGEANEAAETGLDETDEMAARPDVVCTVKEVIAAGRLTWPCDLKVSSPAVPVRCTLDPVLLRRVVSNVLSNAARAAGPSGVVTVQIRQRMALAKLVVEDSGPGFGKIPSGVGLGLSAVARHIVRYGGRMECGRGAGGGARVSLWLPQA